MDDSPISLLQRSSSRHPFSGAAAALRSLSSKRRRARLEACVWISFLLGALCPVTAWSQAAPGDLLITPTRVVFEGRQRTAEVTLVNTGSAPATYRISLIHLRMNDEGGTQEVAADDVRPGERFADPLIRYSPRQVTLAPRIAQTVRMQLRKPDTLEAGEYRSHLLFRAVPAAPQEEAPAAQPKKLSVQLTPIYGISIPVIVRQGETAAKVTVTDLALTAGEGAGAPPALLFRLNRSGSQSVYGNLTATFIPRGGKSLVVGIVNGVAVYTPNAIRNGRIALHAPAGVTLRQGSLRLAYSQADKNNTPLAEAEILLP